MRCVLPAVFPLGLLCCGLVACGADDIQPIAPYEPSPDAGPGLDAKVDVGSDSADSPPSDVTQEGGQDSSETGAEGGVDASAESDVAPDAPADTEPDTGPDPGLDLGGGLLLRPSHPAPGQAVTLEYRGSLSGSANVNLHYGFNGWNEIPGAGLTSQDDGTGNLDFFAEVAMSPLGTGGWEVTIVLPASARALHAVLFTDDGGLRTWDNQGGLDFNAGVPVVLYGPALTWDGSVQPHDGVVVNFHTGWPCKGRVSFGPGDTLTQTLQEADATRAHPMRLYGLQPATQYSYQVGCNDSTDPVVRTFRTAPLHPATFSFAVLGDVQETGEANRWKRTADLLSQGHPDVAFILCIGDMPWNDRPGLWWTFFDQGRDLLGSKVIMPVQGNHDVNFGETAPGKTSLERWFALDPMSGSERYYVQRYGAGAFVVLDSQMPEDFVTGTGVQFDWASHRLNAPPLSDATWVFAAWHIPAYNAGARHWGEQGTFRDITSLFDGRVDWVFSGHEHLYQRTKPLRYNGSIASSGQYGRGSDQGVGYLIAPAAGAWPEVDLIPHTDPKAYYRDRLAYPVVPVPQDTTVSENGFVIVAVDGPTIQLETWGVGGPGDPIAPHLIDAVTHTH